MTDEELWHDAQRLEQLIDNILALFKELRERICELKAENDRLYRLIDTVAEDDDLKLTTASHDTN